MTNIHYNRLRLIFNIQNMRIYLIYKYPNNGGDYDKKLSFY